MHSACCAGYRLEERRPTVTTITITITSRSSSSSRELLLLLLLNNITIQGGHSHAYLRSKPDM